jgi:hypothetical protein
VHCANANNGDKNRERAQPMRPRSLRREITCSWPGLVPFLLAPRFERQIPGIGFGARKTWRLGAGLDRVEVTQKSA